MYLGVLIDNRVEEECKVESKLAKGKRCAEWERKRISKAIQRSVYTSIYVCV